MRRNFYSVIDSLNTYRISSIIFGSSFVRFKILNLACFHQITSIYISFPIFSLQSGSFTLCNINFKQICWRQRNIQAYDYTVILILRAYFIIIWNICANFKFNHQRNDLFFIKNHFSFLKMFSIDIYTHTRPIFLICEGKNLEKHNNLLHLANIFWC